MMIYFDSQDFKYLVEWMDNPQKCDWNNKISEIWRKTLKPQYDIAFLKYKDEKQEFACEDRVTMKNGTEGKIIKVMRLANGQYKYIVEYDGGDDFYKSNPLNSKNLIKTK